MRVVVATLPGQVEINAMWLPTWVALDERLLEELERELAPELEGQPLDDAILDRAHDRAVALIAAKFPTITGLRGMLDSLRNVSLS